MDMSKTLSRLLSPGAALALVGALAFYLARPVTLRLLRAEGEKAERLILIFRVAGLALLAVGAVLILTLT